MKKHELALTLVVLALAGCRPDRQAAVEQINESQTNAEKFDSLQKQINEISEVNLYGVRGPSLVPAMQTSGVTVTADFLWWQATGDDLEYDQKVVAPGGFIDKSFANGFSELKNLDFEWGPGYRVGLGYYGGKHHGWDLFANWTSFDGEARGSHTNNNPDGEANQSPLGSIILLNMVESQSKWHLDYDTLDLEFGHHYFINKRVSLRPHIGLRGARIDQHYHTSAQANVIPPVGSNFPTSFTAKCDFRGIGVRGGSDFIWHFTRHFNLWGELSAAILYGEFRTKEEISGLLQLQTMVSFELDPLPFTIKEKMRRIRTNLQTAIGLGWETCTKGDKQHFAINVGYEFLEWFKQVEFTQFSIYAIPDNNANFGQTNHHGDLGLQGLRVNARFDF